MSPTPRHVPSFGIFWLDRPWAHSRSAPHFKFISFNSHQLSLIPFEQVTPSHSRNSLVLLTRPPLVCPTTMPPTPAPFSQQKNRLPCLGHPALCHQHPSPLPSSASSFKFLLTSLQALLPVPMSYGPLVLAGRRPCIPNVLD